MAARELALRDRPVSEPERHSSGPEAAARRRRRSPRGEAATGLGPIQAIGVDEIQYAKGHKYLTLVYQIEKDCTRLLWIGKDRTIESFEQFFTLIGEPLSEGIKFVCSDMWQP